MSLLNIPVKSFGLAPEFTLPDEEEQESLTSSKTKLTTQTVEDAIGEFGLFQKVLYFLLWFPAAAMAIGVYASVYLEYTPTLPLCSWAGFSRPKLTIHVQPK